MPRLVSLDLIDNAHAAESFFYRNNISTMVATTRSERDLVKSRLAIRAGDYFLPLVRRDLKSDAGVVSEKLDNVEPRKRDSLD